MSSHTVRIAICATLISASYNSSVKAQSQDPGRQAVDEQIAKFQGALSRTDSSKPLTLPRGAVMTQEGQFTITNGRPLAVAAKVLSQKLGVAISYEDPMWASAADVTAVAMPPNYQSPFSRTPVAILEPRDRTFDFALASSESLKGTRPESVIQAVISSYYRFQNSAEFKVISLAGDQYSIAAVSAEDKSGQRIQQLLPLDVRITFPAEKRSLTGALDEICRAVSRSGTTTLINASPDSLYKNNTYTNIGANNETARDVLAKVLGPRSDAGLPPTGKYSWMVYSDPTNKTAVLNLYNVVVEVTRADGTKVLEDVTWAQNSPNK